MAGPVRRPGRRAGDHAPGVRATRALLTAAQIATVIEPCSLIYLIDPLNPLGSSYTAKELADIVEVARASDSYLIHDATYRHFADAHTLAATLYRSAPSPPTASRSGWGWRDSASARWWRHRSCSRR